MRAVDTDFLIAVLRGDPDVEQLKNDLEANGEFFTTVINHFELMAGAYQLGRKRVEKAQVLLSRFQILTMDRFSSAEAAMIYATLRKKGQMIPMRDAMIAGIVKTNGCTFITRDINHFKRVQGLDLHTW